MGFKVDFPGSIAIVDPIRKTTTSLCDVRELLETLDPMTPREYEEYYREILVPLVKAREKLGNNLQKLTKFENKYKPKNIN
jgi:hypothetical protein